MPPKTAPTTATISRSADIQNTSITDATTTSNGLDGA